MIYIDGSLNLNFLYQNLVVSKLSKSPIKHLRFFIKIIHLIGVNNLHKSIFILSTLFYIVFIQRSLGLIFYLWNPNQVIHTTLLSAAFDSVNVRNYNGYYTSKLNQLADCLNILSYYLS